MVRTPTPPRSCLLILMFDLMLISDLDTRRMSGGMSSSILLVIYQYTRGWRLKVYEDGIGNYKHGDRLVLLYLRVEDGRL